MPRGSSLARKQPDPAAQARAEAELLAMEKVVRLLLQNIRQMMRTAGTAVALQSREGRLQLEVFEERRVQAMQLLDSPTGHAESRMAKLARLIEALQFSRAYFRQVQLSVQGESGS